MSVSEGGRERGREKEGRAMRGGRGQLERGDKRRGGGFYAGEGRGRKEEGGRLLIDSGGVGETPRQSRERENPASAG